MNNGRWRTSAAALALVVLAAGCADCGGDSTKTPGAGLPVAGPDSGNQVISCGVDDECPFGQVCREGLCRPSDPSLHDEGCWRDADCDPGYRCAVSSGRCIAAAASPDAAQPPGGDCVTGSSRNCGTKIGVCEYGREDCVAGQWSGSCVGGVRPIDELCDSLDNDCDNDSDETFVLGIPCFDGLGVCRQIGATVCSGDQRSTVCDAVPLDPTGRVERCGNGADDDCDGVEDAAEFDVGTACNAGLGACQQTGVKQCSVDLLGTTCSVSGLDPAGRVELCGNNSDDDCDGVPDNGFTALAQPCQVGSGSCLVTGQWICSVDLLALECQLPSTTELCNGIDDNVPPNDCVDEGYALNADCQAGLGICRTSGVTVCAADQLSVQCNAVPGVGNASELCDGRDDDCDGQTDEDFPLGATCSAGLGICVRSGVRVCSADRLGTTCNAQPGQPGTENCGNQIDEDCDGNLDNGYDVGAACTSGSGVCQRSGVKVCAASGVATVCNAVAGQPTSTIDLCQNGLDDDCNGRVDEGFVNWGQACTAGVGACQAAGVYVCSADLRSTVCNATPGVQTGERCDNIDNDCNGTVDNGCDDDGDDYCDAAMTLVGRPAICPNTTGAVTQDCNDGEAAINPGAAEVCNDNRDQNCNGENSEGCPSCDTRVDDDLDGSNQCVDCDETNGAVRPGATEYCNGIDDDCDDLYDELSDADHDSYTTCGTVPGGGLDPSYVDCDDGNAARHPFACELCALTTTGNTLPCGNRGDRGNLIDEDCDGWTDEGCYPCDLTDRDGDGISQCDGDCIPTDSAVAPGRAELCDGKDNDCNSFTTENCDVGDTCNWATAGTDECRARLLCVESLGNGGNPTGDYTCTSFCNFSLLGLGLGDGCTANQTCSATLTPTANLHGCSVATEIGALATGAACRPQARPSQCRSGNCLTDSRDSREQYCTDLCGSDAYCSGGTACQIWGSYSGRCLKVLSTQTRDVGVACNDRSDYCRNGYLSCVTISTGNKKCTKPCCNNSECPGSYFCSLNGGDAAGPIGGYDTVPVCWPEATTTEHNRVAGQACTNNNQCESEFCDSDLRVCVDICCNDSNCPTGLTCESVVVTRAGGHQSFARVCVNVTPSDALQPCASGGCP